MAPEGERLRGILAWIVIVLLTVPVGGALWLGVAHGESPCILCWAQRTSMVLIALTALFVVRYGPRPRYLGLLILLGAWGSFMALRHSALHLARDVGQGFAGSILGAHTYVWAWAIHWLVLLVAGALLFVMRGPLPERWAAAPGRVARFAMALLVVLAGANAVQAFASTGPPPFIGQADPVRLSWNPRHWVWSLEELAGPVSLRGSWTIPAPDASSVDPDPGSGPLADLPVLGVERRERIAASIAGRITGFALPVEGVEDSDAPGGSGVANAGSKGANGGALVVTDRFGVYLLDDTFSRVLHRVVLDPGFSIDLSPLAAAAFLNGDTLAVMSTNKSYVLLRRDPAADPAREWRHFRESDGGVAELRRSRFATVRARQMYALAMAWDREADEVVTIAVPSPRHRRLVVSRFDRADFLLSSEFLPRIGAGLALRDDGRSLGEYVVTGAVVEDGRLYAISAAHSTLLVIDLPSRTLVAAYAVPGIVGPIGIGISDGRVLIAEEDGDVLVLTHRPPE